MWLHKVSLSSAGLQPEFEDRCYRFAMEAIDRNNVSDMEKSITLLLAGNCYSLRKEYKVLQPIVKEKRFHNYLITLEVKQIKISSVSIFSEICFQEGEEEINIFSVFIVFIYMVTYRDNKNTASLDTLCWGFFSARNYVGLLFGK